LKSAITPRTKAVMPVHLYGHPFDVDPILRNLPQAQIAARRRRRAGRRRKIQRQNSRHASVMSPASVFIPGKTSARAAKAAHS
jgi:hypothetical protein